MPWWTCAEKLLLNGSRKQFLWCRDTCNTHFKYCHITGGAPQAIGHRVAGSQNLFFCGGRGAIPLSTYAPETSPGCKPRTKKMTATSRNSVCRARCGGSTPAVVLAGWAARRARSSRTSAVRLSSWRRDGDSGRGSHTSRDKQQICHMCHTRDTCVTCVTCDTCVTCATRAGGLQPLPMCRYPSNCLNCSAIWVDR